MFKNLFYGDSFMRFPSDHHLDECGSVFVDMDFSRLTSQHRILAHASVERIHTCVEWRLRSQQHKEKHTTREDIHRRPFVLCCCFFAQLRCLVLGRAALGFQDVGVIACESLHHSKVADFHVHLCIDQDILKFHVSVGDALFM